MIMLSKRVVSTLLSKILGDLVENISTDDLKLGLFSGDVVLENLRIKPDALDKLLDLPLRVTAGFIGRLHLKIPFTHLTSRPTVVEVERVYAVAEPRVETRAYDADKAQQAAKDELAAKKAQLLAIEAAERAKAGGKKAAAAAGGDTFVSKLVAKIVNNLQATIRRVHVRVEDGSSDPKRPCAFGVLLHELRAASVGHHGAGAGGAGGAGGADGGSGLGAAVFGPYRGRWSKSAFHKHASLRNLALYWDTRATGGSHAGGYAALGRAAFQSAMDAPFDRWDGARTTRHAFLLHPVSAELRLTLDAHSDGGGARGDGCPKTAVAGEVAAIRVELRRSQYAAALALAGALGTQAARAAYTKEAGHHAGDAGDDAGDGGAVERGARTVDVAGGGGGAAPCPDAEAMARWRAWVRGRAFRRRVGGRWRSKKVAAAAAAADAAADADSDDNGGDGGGHRDESGGGGGGAATTLLVTGAAAGVEVAWVEAAFASVSARDIAAAAFCPAPGAEDGGGPGGGSGACAPIQGGRNCDECPSR